MDEDLKEALSMIEYLHAAVWCHFDPTYERGDKDMPKDLKDVLKKARKVLKKNGLDVFRS